MRLRVEDMAGGPRRCGSLLLCVAILAWCGFAAAPARAADAPPPIPAAAADTLADTPAAAGAIMASTGWLEDTIMRLEHEAGSDISMLPDTPSALAREWRSFDRDGSAIGALVNLCLVILAACVALLAERLAVWVLGRRVRRRLRARVTGPTIPDLLLVLLCDFAGLGVLAWVFVSSRHWLINAGVPMNLVLLSASVLIRWRALMLIPRVVLRPHEPTARLIDLPDGEARRLTRFLSAVVLAIAVLIGFGRYGLADEDSGAPHIIGLVVAAAVCGLNTWILFRSRAAVDALIRGYRTEGIIAALRAGLARAWVAIGLGLIAGLMVFFVFGLSLGLLSYYHAGTSTLGVLIVLLVLDRLTERGSHAIETTAISRGGGIDRLLSRSLRRLLRGIILLAAVMTLAWTWVDAIELTTSAATAAMRAVTAAVGTLFVAYLVWELARLAIDRHLQDVGGGPRLPGAADDDEESAPASRLQTILPMMRAFFGVAIGVVAVLIVLSRLGVDTAPLIAGAGVFGLAVSFGSQSLVRDIISGLFYMWDDAFRVGEYIDTGRLKGTVEMLGVRSLKLRHHNGPLHTIPYGQLGAVTNLSRDYATIKFNLRLEPGTDIELVRRTAKQIGLATQEDSPEVAAEVILPLKMQGIAEVADTAVVLRFKFTARPVKPSWIQREYLKRMYRVFAEKGIVFASGALTLRTMLPPSADDVTAADVAALPLPAPSRVA